MIVHFELQRLKVVIDQALTYKSRKKGTIASVHAMQEYGGVKAQPHSFLTSALDRVQRSTKCPGFLTSGNEPQYPLDRRLNGPQIRYGQFRRREKNQPCRNSKLRSYGPQPITMPTRYSRRLKKQKDRNDKR